MRRLIVSFGLCLGLTAPVFAAPAMTIAPTLMRAAPSPKARIVQDIPGNAQIDLSHCSGDWCYASWRDLFGYVRAAAVGTATPRPLRPALLRTSAGRLALVGLGTAILLRLWMGLPLVASAGLRGHPRHGVSGIGVSGPLPSTQDNRLSTTSSAMARAGLARAPSRHAAAARRCRARAAPAGTFGSFSKTSRPAARIVRVAQGRDQRRLVDQRAARDVDQHAVGAQRRQHLGVDDVAGRRRRPARRPSGCRRPRPCRASVG